MSPAILTALALALAGLIASLVLGHIGMSDRAIVFQHATVATFTTLLVLLAQSMAMFYLIGKGKAIKDVAAEGGLDASYARAVRGFHQRLFPIATFAVLLTMAAAILGGGVATRAIPAWVHGALAYGAVVLNAISLVVEARVLADSARVVDDLNRRLRA